MADELEPDGIEEDPPEKKDDPNDNIVVDGLDPDPDPDPDSDPDLDLDETVSKKDYETLQEKLTRLEGDKKNLNKALHEARQKKAAKEDAPLTEDQLLKILQDNEGDPQTMLNIVKYQAEQAAKKVSGDVLSDAETKKKGKEANSVLKKMYPSLDDDSSEMRTAVDETKSYYGLDGHPLGDYFATGVQVLNALPSLIEAAERRGKDAALKDNADVKRKESIKDNLTPKGGKKTPPGAGLTMSQKEAADQLNLTPGQLKTYKQIVGKTATVQVKE